MDAIRIMRSNFAFFTCIVASTCPDQVASRGASIGESSCELARDQKFFFIISLVKGKSGKRAETLPILSVVLRLTLANRGCDGQQRQIGAYLKERTRATTWHDRAPWKLWRLASALRTHLYIEPRPVRLEGIENGPERDSGRVSDEDAAVWKEVK